MEDRGIASAFTGYSVRVKEGIVTAFSAVHSNFPKSPLWCSLAEPVSGFVLRFMVIFSSPKTAPCPNEYNSKTSSVMPPFFFTVEL